jgi:hypothetical protein
MHKVQLQKPDQYEITIKIGFYLSNKSRNTIGYQTSEVPLANCVPVFLRERCIDVSICQAASFTKNHQEHT